MEINGADDPDISLVRVEIGYCPRCGTLRAFPVGAAAEFCEACMRILEWMHTEWKRPRHRRKRRAAGSRGGQR